MEEEPLISLQQVRSQSPFEEVIIVQPAEEVISDEPLRIPNPVVGSDQILVPVSDSLADHDQEVSVGTTKSKKGSKRSRKSDSREDGERKMSKKWEQKQVQIKTLEGEFSVTMWASGTLQP